MSATLLMDQYEVAQQTLVESGLMKYLTDGLRNALAWQVQGESFARKLATLQFICKSVQRHMERLLSLEEVDGYMDIVLATKPSLSKAVDALKHEHDHFRHEIGRLVRELEFVLPADRATFMEIVADLTKFLDDFEQHSRKETEMFQEAFEQEEGGEG